MSPLLLPTQKIGDTLAQLVKLEEETSAVAATAYPEDAFRTYLWRPLNLPELPAMWNWIDSGEYDIVDTHRGDDILVVACTIGVKAGDFGEKMDQLVRIMDVFREVSNPALASHLPLNDTARYARRVVTRSHIEDFEGIPVLCLANLIRLDLVGRTH
jgi:hypothetical protein